MRVGVCYYPEHWPEERWRADARAMVDAGLEVVRIGEFAWSRIEAQRGAFAWGWLDRAVETLIESGLEVVMGTPTATPPVWLVRERPDILATAVDGRRRAYGSRRHTCPTSTSYREESVRIASEMAGRYGETAAAWQLDNEPGNHDSARCWCGECGAAFRRWLAQRYGSVEALNRAWGGVFWSMSYPDLEAVELPVPTVTDHNPSLLLAHRRFASHQVVGGLHLQAEAVRKRAPGRPLFVNLYEGDRHVDLHELARLADTVAIDNYPQAAEGAFDTALALDLAVGAVSEEGHAWVMEQQVGHLNWLNTNPPVAPGQVRVWIWQAAAHGIDTLLCFRWRASRLGQEQYHSGLLAHDGSPTPALAEVRETIAEVKRLGALGRPQPRVALLASFEDDWAWTVSPHRAGWSHRQLLLDAYRAARACGEEVAVVPPDADLTRYELVLGPGLHLASPARVAGLEAALEAGVSVVLGPRALVKDFDHVWFDGALPGGMARRLGARVAAFHSLDRPVTVDPWGSAVGVWAEELEASAGTEVLARYGPGSALAGSPAVVQREGLCYVGFDGSEAWVGLLGHLLDASPDLSPVESVHRGRIDIRIDHQLLTVDLS